jgi:hypothetical protein
MAKRYGRNQRRAHRAEIEALKTKLYGIWGEPPADMPRIDHVPHLSIYTRKTESRERIEEDVTITYLVIEHSDFEKIMEARESGTTLVHGDMCLYPVGLAMERTFQGISHDGRGYRDSRLVGQEIEAEFRRVRAPR